MSGRTEYIKNIRQRLELLERYSQTYSNRDILLELDPIICGLLNRTYGYRLASVNQTQGNIPVITLADSGNSIAVLVTALNSRRKVDDTVRRFYAGTRGQRLCDSYKSLIIFILARENLRYMPPEGLDFTVQLLNISSLMDHVQTLPQEKLKEILDFLTDEMGAGEIFSTGEIFSSGPVSPMPQPFPPSSAPQPHPAPPSTGTSHLRALSPDRQQVLRFACLLPQEGLSWELFRQCLSEVQQQALFHLVSEQHLVHDGDMLRLSPAIRRDCLEQLRPTRDNCGEFLDRLLQYDRTRFWKRLKLVPQRKVHIQLAQTFAQAAELLYDPEGSLALRSAAFYTEIREYANALQGCLRAVRSCEAELIRDPWHLGNAYLRTAECFQQLLDNGNSLKYCKKALSLLGNNFLPSDPDLVQIYYQTASVQVSLNQYPAALINLNKAWDYSTNTLSQDHPRRSEISNLLSIANMAAGNVDEAREHKLQSVFSDSRSASPYTQSAELVQKLSQLDNVLGLPRFIRGNRDEILYSEIGDLYRAQGDYPQALEYHMQALKLRETRTGTAPAKLADSYHSIGLIFSDLDDHNEAMQYLQKAVRIREKNSGIPAGDLIRSYLDLGAVHSDCGMHQYALEYFSKALSLQMKSLPDGSPEMAGTYSALGNVCRTLGRNRESLEHYTMAVTLLESSLWKDHPDLAAACMNLANALAQQGQYQAALNHARRALHIYQKSFPEGSPQQITARQTVSWLEDMV